MQNNLNTPVQLTSRDQERTYTLPPAKHMNTINIATHNIREITTQTGQNSLLEEITERKICVLGISETKLTKENQKFAFNNTNQYKCFTSAGTIKPFGSGVILLVEKNLEHFVASVTRIEGYLIAISLKSKKCKIFIAQIYLPCDQKESQRVQSEVEKILSQKIQENFEIILMGDFNAVINPRKDKLRKDSETTFSPSDRPEIGLFNYLINLGLIDIQQTWEGENTTYTWTNKQSSSRIDYIWTTKELAISLRSFKNIQFKDISNSDHSFLQMSLPTENIILSTPEPLRGKQTKQKIINLDKTSEKQWDKFKERIEKKISKSDIQKEITAVLNKNPIDNNIRTIINNIWSKFKNIIISSAFCCLYCSIKILNKSKNTHGLEKITRKKTLEFRQYRTIVKILTK